MRFYYFSKRKKKKKALNFLGKKEELKLSLAQFPLVVKLGKRIKKKMQNKEIKENKNLFKTRWFSCIGVPSSSQLNILILIFIFLTILLIFFNLGLQYLFLSDKELQTCETLLTISMEEIDNMHVKVESLETSVEELKEKLEQTEKSFIMTSLEFEACKAFRSQHISNEEKLKLLNIEYYKEQIKVQGLIKVIKYLHTENTDLKRLLQESNDKIDSLQTKANTISLEEPNPLSSPYQLQFLSSSPSLSQSSSKSFSSSPYPIHQILPNISSNHLLQSYIELHNSILTKYHLSKTPQKFLIFKNETSGFGNTVTAFISTFFLALASKRALLLKMPTLENVFQINPKLNLTIPDSLLSSINSEKVISFVHVGGYENMGGSPPGSHWYNSLACNDLSEVYSDQPLIEVVSNQYFASLIINNPHHQETFLSNFHFNAFFYQAFSFLFTLKPSIQQIVDNIVSSYLSGHFSIGIHIRKEFLTTAKLYTFWSCAKQIMISKAPSNQQVRFYIATDSPKEDIMEIFDSDIIFLDDIRPKLDEQTKKMVDLYVVGACDQLLVTAGSTFSDIIFARTGKLPWKVTNVNTCEQFPHSEPCYFYWKDALESSCYTEENYYKSLIQNPTNLNSGNCYTF